MRRAPAARAEFEGPYPTGDRSHSVEDAMRADTSTEQDRAERALHAKRARDEIHRLRSAQRTAGKRHSHDERAPYYRLRATRRG